MLIKYQYTIMCLSRHKHYNIGPTPIEDCSTFKGKGVDEVIIR